MAKSKATPLTASEFASEVLNRLDGAGYSRSDVKRIMDAIAEEAQDCIANGYSVPLLSLVKIEPVVKKGRKKGTVVRNPFDGTTKTLRSDESDSVKVKAKPLGKLKNALPSPKSKAGKELIDALS